MKKDRPLTGQSSKSKVTIVDSNTQNSMTAQDSIKEDPEGNKDEPDKADPDSNKDTKENKNQESGGTISIKADPSNLKPEEKLPSSSTLFSSTLFSSSDDAASNLKSESQILETLTSAQDLQKEMESEGKESEEKESSYAESVNAHDSGNEGDVDTEIRSRRRKVRRAPPPVLREREEPMTRVEVHREYAKRMAERLTQAALLAGGRDNITVMVVLLPGSGL